MNGSGDQADAKYPYDLFVSFAEDNRPWVEGTLLDALKEAGVRYSSEATTFRPGAYKVDEFAKGVEQAGRTLLVLSPAYLADGFTRFVAVLAQSADLEAETHRVIPLLLKPVSI